MNTALLLALAFSTVVLALLLVILPALTRLPGSLQVGKWQGAASWWSIAWGVSCGGGVAGLLSVALSGAALTSPWWWTFPALGAACLLSLRRTLPESIELAEVAAREPVLREGLAALFEDDEGNVTDPQRRIVWISPAFVAAYHSDATGIPAEQREDPAAYIGRTFDEVWPTYWKRGTEAGDAAWKLADAVYIRGETVTSQTQRTDGRWVQWAMRRIPSGGAVSITREAPGPVDDRDASFADLRERVERVAGAWPDWSTAGDRLEALSRRDES